MTTNDDPDDRGRLLEALLDLIRAIEAKTKTKAKGATQGGAPSPTPKPILHPGLPDFPWPDTNFRIPAHDLPAAPPMALREAMAAAAKEGALITCDEAGDGAADPIRADLPRLVARAFTEGWLMLYSNGSLVLTREGHAHGATSPTDVIDHLRLSDPAYSHTVKHIIAYRGAGAGAGASPQEVQRWVGPGSIKTLSLDPDPRYDLLVAYHGLGVAVKAWYFDHDAHTTISVGMGPRSRFVTEGPAALRDYLRARLHDNSHPMGSSWHETEDDGPTTLLQ